MIRFILAKVLGTAKKICNPLARFRGGLTRYAVALLAVVYPNYKGERGLIQPGCYFGFFFLLSLMFQATMMAQDGDNNCTDFTELITDLLGGAMPTDITEIPHMMHKR